MCSDHLQHWLPWFLLGDILAKKINAVSAFLDKYHISLLLFVPYIVHSFISPIAYGDSLTISMQMSVILVIISLFYITQKYVNIPSKSFYTIVSHISNVSFGLYVFHFWFGPYILSSTAQRLLPLSQLAADYVWLFPFIFTIITIFASYVATRMLQMIKAGQLLLG